MKMPPQGQGRVASHKDNSTQKLWHTLEILQQFSVWATCEYCAVVLYKQYYHASLVIISMYHLQYQVLYKIINDSYNML